MTPKLKVSISSSSQIYPPTSLCHVNSSTPTQISTPDFEGEISVWVKDFTGEGLKGDGKEYFGTKGREGMTYGIVVRGRFLKSISADDIVFGNVFEKPIKDSLPWGTSIAQKFMYFVDPNLELDIYCDKPWALSPVVATMNYLSLTPSKKSSSSSTTTTSSATIKEHTSETTKSLLSDELKPSGWEDDSSSGVSARRKFFTNKEHRKGLILGEGVEVGMEFANGLLDFNTLSATLPQPFHLSIPLLKYWDGQPVTYICKSRDGSTTFFAVAFQIIDKGDGKEVEVEESKPSADETEKVGKVGKGKDEQNVLPPGTGEEVTISDDVD